MGPSHDSLLQFSALLTIKFVRWMPLFSTDRPAKIWIWTRSCRSKRIPTSNTRMILRPNHRHSAIPWKSSGHSIRNISILITVNTSRPFTSLFFSVVLSRIVWIITTSRTHRMQQAVFSGRTKSGLVSSQDLHASSCPGKVCFLFILNDWGSYRFIIVELKLLSWLAQAPMRLS